MWFRNIYRFSIKNYNSSKDYYKVLNIQKSSSQKQIKKAFRDLAKKYHPDANKGNEQKFKQINQAYQVLSSCDIRKQYDQQRSFGYGAKNQSQNNSQYTKSDPFTSYYGSSQTHQNKTNNNYSQQESTHYRGYSKSKGWENLSEREKIIYQMFKSQMGSASRKPNNYNRSSHYNDHFRQNIQSKFDQMQRKDTEKILKRREEIRKMRQQEEQKMQKQYEEYKGQQYDDLKQKFVSRVNKAAETITDNVKGAAKIASILKEMWDSTKKK